MTQYRCMITYSPDAYDKYAKDIEHITKVKFGELGALNFNQFIETPRPGPLSHFTMFWTPESVPFDDLRSVQLAPGIRTEVTEVILARSNFGAKGVLSFQRFAFNSGYPPFHITLFEAPDSVSLEELQSVQLAEGVMTQVQRVERAAER
ncbi:uncharacterized protein EURHEDRAFT_380562 [Aspergillus ruber CBS 135680]|uniref:Uncharacterized protein n=1 Tax=Aspergillus ruber (strain CBS 135680) TaxID=1388766 RepID=A0A017S4D9_ASPRC|nr:uncharacterized protein EURHEDRAFT_380562 [Aspergillus ruber CBS 135680]EYE91898.1 hypothetical protein EURHEDRAFT_380562 [Aspergillus ruber CBS 135680]